MRALLAQHRPDHAVLGEEEGLIGDPASPLEVDPRSDRRHGVVRARAPDLGDADRARARGRDRRGRRICARARPAVVGREVARAHRAIRDRCRCRPSIASRTRTSGTPASARGGSTGRGPQFDALAHRVWRSRGVGDFWMHVLVAEGVFDVAAEPIVSLWDLAAVKVIVEEAGGRFTDLSGVARADGGSALSTNGLLHDAALAASVVSPSRALSRRRSRS